MQVLLFIKSKNVDVGVVSMQSNTLSSWMKKQNRQTYVKLQTSQGGT